MARIHKNFLQPFPLALAILCLLTGLAMFVSVLAFRTDGRRKVNAELAKLQERGFVIDADELFAMHYDVSWAPEENAERELQMAFPLIKTDRETWAALPQSSDWNSVEEVDAAYALLEENAEALELVHRASKRPYLRFPLDISTDDFPVHLAPLREAARLLRLEARARLHEGSPDVALESIQALLRLVLLLGEEPNLWSQMTVLAVGNHAIFSAHELLEKFTLPAEDLKELQQLLEAIEQQALVETGLQGEIVSAGPRLKIRFQEHFWLHVLHSWTGLYLRDQAFYLAQIRALEPIHNDPNQLAALKEAYDAFSFNPLRDEGRASVAGLILTPYYLARNNLSSVAYNRILRTLLAMERFRHDHDRLPEPITDLEPAYLESLVDPFTGAKFEFFFEEEFLVVKSAGTTGPRDDPKIISLRIPLE